LHEGKCSIFSGSPCRYFEYRVIGSPNYPYRPKGYDYATIDCEYRVIAKKRKYFASIKEYENWPWRESKKQKKNQKAKTLVIRAAFLSKRKEVL